MAIYVGGSALSSGTTIQSSYNSVGNYVFANFGLANNVAATVNPTSGGDRLYPSNGEGSYSGSYYAAAGTWRVLGYCRQNGLTHADPKNATLFQRIS